MRLLEKWADALVISCAVLVMLAAGTALATGDLSSHAAVLAGFSMGAGVAATVECLSDRSER